MNWQTVADWCSAHPMAVTIVAVALIAFVIGAVLF